MQSTQDFIQRLLFLTDYSVELNKDHGLDFEVSSQGDTVTVSSKMLHLHHNKISDIAGYLMMVGVRIGLERDATNRSLIENKS